MDVFVVKQEKLSINKRTCRVDILKWKARGDQLLSPHYSLHVSTVKWVKKC